MIGIIAGSGELPFLAEKNIRAAGLDYRIFLVAGQEILDPLPHPEVCVPITITKWGHVIRALKSHGVRDILLLGKIDKSVLFKNPRFDLRALYLLSRMLTRNDSDFFRLLAGDLARNGMTVIEQTRYLREMFLDEGIFGHKRPDRATRRDADYAWELAKNCAALDIGQTVVVSGQSILAVEAIEGTNEAIRRGAALARGRPVVVGKVARPAQDWRFDIPTVGVTTIEVMRECGVRALVFEAGKTFMVTPERVIAAAERAGIALIGKK